MQAVKSFCWSLHLLWVSSSFLRARKAVVRLSLQCVLSHIFSSFLDDVIYFLLGISLKLLMFTFLEISVYAQVSLLLFVNFIIVLRICTKIRKHGSVELWRHKVTAFTYIYPHIQKYTSKCWTFLFAHISLKTSSGNDILKYPQGNDRWNNLEIFLEIPTCHSNKRFSNDNLLKHPLKRLQKFSSRCKKSERCSLKKSRRTVR